MRKSLLALIVLFAPASAIAQQRPAPTAGTCGNFMSFTAENVKKFGPLFDEERFSKKGSAYALLEFFYSKPQAQFEKWILLVRASAPEPSVYCLKAEGKQYQIMPDIPDNTSNKRFGLPGSGFPRCSSKDEIPGGFYLRMWANRELGPSLDLDLESQSGYGHDYAVLISQEDGAWVIVDERKTGSACYFQRGGSSGARTGLTIPRTSPWHE